MSQSEVEFEKTKADLIRRLATLGHDDERARTWYQTQPIPAFGGLTAHELVLAGRAEDVDRYIDHLELGGFA
jgi:hypothetical protein